MKEREKENWKCRGKRNAKQGEVKSNNKSA